MTQTDTQERAFAAAWRYKRKNAHALVAIFCCGNRWDWTLKSREELQGLFSAYVSDYIPLEQTSEIKL